MIEKKSLRVFGLIWATIFGFFCYKNNNNVILFFLSIFFVINSLFFPRFFTKTYIFQGWVKFGNFIGHINSKIIIFIMFFFIFLPTGILLKIFKKDLLKKKLNKNTISYFEKRNTQPGSMMNQF